MYTPHSKPVGYLVCVYLSSCLCPCLSWSCHVMWNAVCESDDLQTSPSHTRLIFSDNLVYTFAWYNTIYGITHQKLYSDNDLECAGVLREFLITDMYDIRHGTPSTESMH